MNQDLSSDPLICEQCCAIIAWFFAVPIIAIIFCFLGPYRLIRRFL